VPAKHKGSNDWAELRKKAEKKAKENEDKTGLPLTPEEAQHTLHELRVHQIELEMQNEELRGAQAEIEAARGRYFDLYDMAPVGYVTLNGKGLILEANLASARMLGITRAAMVKQPLTRFILKEDQDIYYLHRKQLFDTGEPQECELRMQEENGATFWAHLSAIAASDAASALVCRVVMEDVSHRRFQEEVRDLTTRLIFLVDSPDDFRAGVAALTSALHSWSGCEAVGIRLRSGDDFPYYETRGFPATFVQEENHLCAYGPDSKVLRDGKGNPILECMCGNILNGRFDPTRPFFTPHGSFWSNNTSALLASTTENDRQWLTRNRCIGEGYESVALVPLRAGNVVFGLLQFNDHIPNRFTLALIEHFERMADSVAIALSRRHAEEELRKSEKRFRTITEQTSDFIAITDEKGIITYASTASETLFYCAPEEMCGRLFTEFVNNSDVIRATDVFRGAMERGERAKNLEFTMKRKDGSLFTGELNGLRFQHGSQDGTLVVIRDITERKQAEEALRESEEHFRQLFDHMGEGVAIYRALGEGEDFEFVDINRMGQVMSEIARDVAVGRRVTDCFPAVERIGLLDVFRRVWKTGKAEQHPMTEYADGRILQWVENYVYRLPSGLIVAIYADTSEKRRAEEALRESEVRYRTALETAMDGFWMCDTQGRLLVVNAAYSRMSGYTEDELLTMSISDLEDVESSTDTAKHISSIIAMGEQRFETRHRRKDGTTFDVEVSVRHMPTENGNMVTFFQDITERKQAEEALRESEARFRQLFQLAPLGYQSLDADGHIIDVNQAWLDLLGYSRSEVIGKWFGDFHTPTSRGLFEERFPVLKKQGIVHGAEFDLVRRDGSVVTCSLDGRVALTPKGEFRQTHCILTDVTVRKQAEEQIHRQLDELHRWQDVMLGREDRMQELKREVNELGRRLGEPLRYPSQEAGPESQASLEPKP